jgi:hypothetical protein
MGCGRSNAASGNLPKTLRASVIESGWAGMPVSVACFIRMCNGKFFLHDVQIIS